MNIAIVGTFTFHSFMAGFLLQIFETCNIVLYHTYPDDYKDIDYFMKIFNFTLDTNVRHIVRKQRDYDYIFVLSANDPITNMIVTTNCYTIIHALTSINHNNFKEILSLSKKIQFTHNNKICKYIFRFNINT